MNKSDRNERYADTFLGSAGPIPHLWRYSLRHRFSRFTPVLYTCEFTRNAKEKCSKSVLGTTSLRLFLHGASSAQVISRVRAVDFYAKPRFLGARRFRDPASCHKSVTIALHFEAVHQFLVRIRATSTLRREAVVCGFGRTRRV